MQALWKTLCSQQAMARLLQSRRTEGISQADPERQGFFGEKGHRTRTGKQANKRKIGA